MMSRIGSDDVRHPQVRQHFRRHQRVGLCARLPSHRAGCHRSIAAQGKFTREQTVHPLLVHEQEDEVSGLGAGLEAEAAAP